MPLSDDQLRGEIKRALNADLQIEDATIIENAIRVLIVEHGGNLGLVKSRLQIALTKVVHTMVVTGLAQVSESQDSKVSWKTALYETQADLSKSLDLEVNRIFAQFTPIIDRVLRELLAEQHAPAGTMHRSPSLQAF